MVRVLERHGWEGISGTERVKEQTNMLLSEIDVVIALWLEDKEGVSAEMNCDQIMMVLHR